MFVSCAFFFAFCFRSFVANLLFFLHLFSFCGCFSVIEVQNRNVLFHFVAFAPMNASSHMIDIDDVKCFGCYGIWLFEYIYFVRIQSHSTWHSFVCVWMYSNIPDEMTWISYFLITYFYVLVFYFILFFRLFYIHLDFIKSSNIFSGSMFNRFDLKGEKRACYKKCSSPAENFLRAHRVPLSFIFAHFV